jgi:hypothetical protein
MAGTTTQGDPTIGFEPDLAHGFAYSRELPPDVPPGMTLDDWRHAHHDDRRHRDHHRRHPHVRLHRRVCPRVHRRPHWPRCATSAGWPDGTSRQPRRRAPPQRAAGDRVLSDNHFDPDVAAE